MPYFDYQQFNLLEEIVNRYKASFPDCDLTKKAEMLDIAGGFKKDAYFESVQEDVLDRIQYGYFDDDGEEVVLTDEELSNITYRVMRWADYSALNETIDEAIDVELDTRTSA